MYIQELAACLSVREEGHRDRAGAPRVARHDLVVGHQGYVRVDRGREVGRGQAAARVRVLDRNQTFL